jgi:hypothetical protein
MENIGQIQPAKKPAKDKINSAYQHSNPRSQMSWGGVHTSQHVGKNNQIACEIVYFHYDSPWDYSNIKRSLLSNNKLMNKRLEPVRLGIGALRFLLINSSPLPALGQGNSNGHGKSHNKHSASAALRCRSQRRHGRPSSDCP